MYYARIEENIIKGFYCQESYNANELNFNYIIIDEELQNYIRNNSAFYINEFELIKLTSEEQPVLTIEDKQLFKKIDIFEKE